MWTADCREPMASPSSSVRLAPFQGSYSKTRKRQKKGRSPRKPLRTPEPQFTHLNPVADYLPIRKIENGIIYTKDHRYVKS